MKIELTSVKWENAIGFEATNKDTEEKFAATWDPEVPEVEKQFRIHEAMTHLGNKIIEWMYPGYEKDLMAENILPRTDA